MRGIAKALYEFWSGFGVDAYAEGKVPDDVALPYIVYPILQPNWRSQMVYQPQVWDRSSSFENVTQLVDAIGNAVGEGLELELDDGEGYIFLFRENNFAQFTPTDTDDEFVHVVTLTFTIHALTA